MEKAVRAILVILNVAHNGMRRYDRTSRFSYDALSRLTSARYSDARGADSHYDTSYTYDLNGNITTLLRNGLRSSYGPQYGAIDDMEYEYRGNRVTRITDRADDPVYYGANHFIDGADEDEEYTYNANGNMTRDLNRGIASVSYDLNQRPRTIEFTGGGRTDYLYDMDGRKLGAQHTVATEPLAVASGAVTARDYTYTFTDYCGNLIYEDFLLTRINLENGYIALRGDDGSPLAEPHYHFFVRDHLGNNRVDLDLTAGAEFKQIAHYYPFGLLMEGGLHTGSQRWLFGGKELDRVSGLDHYDFDARAYDPATIRFTRPDDLSEQYLPTSSYAYCLNNPLRFIDLTGRAVWELKQDGRFASQEVNEEYDAIRIVGTGASTPPEIKVDKNSIIQFKAFDKEEHANIKDSFLYMKVESSVGDAVFEFLAENTTVEWSNLSTGEKQQTNHITTSHEESKEYGLSMMMTAFQESGTVKVNAIVHSHPSNTPYPSDADKDAAEYFNSISGQQIQYKLYLPGEKTYIDYY